MPLSRRAHRRWAVLLTLVVLVVGCGGPDDVEESPPADPAADGTSTAEDPGGQDEDHPVSDEEAEAGTDAACEPPHDDGGAPLDDPTQEDDVAEAPPSLCGPGPDEPTEDLVIEELALQAREGDDPLQATFVVTNTTDLTREMILPTIAPRAESVDGGVRLSYLRIRFVHDEDGISNPRIDTDRPGDPEVITIAAGDTVTIDRAVSASTQQVADRMRLCFEVLPAPHPDTPLASLPSGGEQVLPSFEIGYAPGQPVPLTCSGEVEVS